MHIPSLIERPSRRRGNLNCRMMEGCWGHQAIKHSTRSRVYSLHMFKCACTVLYNTHPSCGRGQVTAKRYSSTDALSSTSQILALRSLHKFVQVGRLCLVSTLIEECTFVRLAYGNYALRACRYWAYVRCADC